MMFELIKDFLIKSKNDFIEATRFGKLVGIMVATLFCYIVMGIFFYIYIHPISLGDTLEESSYILASNWEQSNGKLVKDTIEFCRPFDDTQQVVCVVTRVGMKYNYTARPNGTLITGDNFYKDGYMCRDIAVVYDAIFKKLGWFSDYVFTTDHVYNTVFKKQQDCLVNMERWWCW